MGHSGRDLDIKPVPINTKVVRYKYRYKSNVARIYC